MILHDRDTLAEILANDYEFDLELTDTNTIRVYKDTMTLDDCIKLHASISNIELIEYKDDYIVIGLSEI